MGMRGAALATGVSPIISIGICMIHYLSKKNTIVFKWHLPSFKLLASAAGLGVVAFVGEIANSITTLVFNFILLALSGNNAVAAYGVIANIALVGTAIFNGVSQGLQPLASTSYGHGDKEDVKKILRQSLVIAVILSIVLVSAVWVFAQGLVGIFNSAQSAELAKFAVPGLRIYFLGFLVAAVNIVLAGFFSATGQALASSLIAVSRGIIVISLMAFMLSKLFGVTGVWMAFPVTEVVTFGIAMGIQGVSKRKE
jgi:Na+-driven multidrug efflux pump